MDNVLIPLLSGLVGVIIGSFTSIITIIIQARNENKRALTKNAVELALEDYRISTEHAKLHGSAVFPLSLYIHYHVRIMEYANKGQLTKENLNKIGLEQDELREVMIADTKRMKSEKK